MDFDEIIKEIHIQRGIGFNSSRNFQFPDNVMMHFSKKDIIRDKLKEMSSFNACSKVLKVFGMLVIFTDAIDENQIICTYNVK